MQPTKTMSEARRRGFVALRSTAPDYKLNNGFYAYCEATDRPYLRLWLKTKYVGLELDLIAQSWRLSEHASREIQNLLSAANVGRRPSWQLGTRQTFVTVNRIPAEIAGNVAAAVLAILDRAGYREPLYLDTATPTADAIDAVLAK